MKLIRFGEKGKERPGIWWEGQRRDCSAWFTDWNADFFRQGGVDALRMRQDSFGHFPIVPEQERWASPVTCFSGMHRTKLRRPRQRSGFGTAQRAYLFFEAGQYPVRTF